MKWLAIVLLILLPSSGLAYGPGVHIREAERTLELLEEADPDWIQPATEEMALAYLRLGAIAPDFQWATDLLGFGHGKALSYALQEAASDMPPRYRFFALGHLIHIASDASSEVFFSPTIFASAPLGPFDLFAADNNAKAETEAICEAYGDFILGDWNAVVDLIYDFHKDSIEADEAFAEIFLWYCGTGKSFYEDDTDCEGALEGIQGLLASADTFIAGLDRAEAKILVNSLINQSYEGLFALYTGGILQDFVGGEYSLSDHFGYFEDLFLSSALVTDELWALYDDFFVNLGPRLALEHREYQVTGWPEYDGVSLISGNIQSMLQFLPEHYDPVPHLRLNALSWHGPDGEEVAEASEVHNGQTLSARMTLHSAIPYAGTITAVVKRDHPGFWGEDDVLGSAAVEVDINPESYSLLPRTELEVSFIANNEDVMGYYIELGTNETEKPWMTSNWDQIWTIDALDLAQPIYGEHFGTYHHWPPSLPIANVEEKSAAILAKAFIYPAGPPIANITTHLGSQDSETLTGINGISHFGGLNPGDYTVMFSSEDHVWQQVDVKAEALVVSWAKTALHPIPRPKPPSPTWGDPLCIPFTWDLDTFGGQTESFKGTLQDSGSNEDIVEETEVGNTGEGKLCTEEPLPDAMPLVIELVGTYVDGSPGFPGSSEPFVIDTSPPDILEIEIVPEDPPTCGQWTEAFIPSIHVSIVHQAVSPGVQEVEWRLGETLSWQQVEPFEIQKTGEADDLVLSFFIEEQSPLPSPTLEIRLRVASGNTASIAPTTIVVADPSVLCLIDENPDNNIQEEEASDGGCQVGHPIFPTPLALLFLIGLFVRRKHLFTD